jgi:uncharacterized Zn-binding protein involved in type VI secretion
MVSCRHTASFCSKHVGAPTHIPGVAFEFLSQVLTGVTRRARLSSKLTASSLVKLALAHGKSNDKRDAMTIRYHITLGARTTAGGKVVSATSHRSINGVKVACAGDAVYCPGCNSEGVIEPDGPRISDRFNGRQVGLSDDVCRCKCNPPPRLIANQTISKQIIDGDWAAARAGAATETVTLLNTAERSAAAEPAGVPLILLDPRTKEPYSNRRYKLELKDKIIEGTTDQHGVTKPILAADRAEIVRWHIEGETGPA